MKKKLIILLVSLYGGSTMLMSENIDNSMLVSESITSNIVVDDNSFHRNVDLNSTIFDDSFENTDIKSDEIEIAVDSSKVNMVTEEAVPKIDPIVIYNGNCFQNNIKLDNKKLKDLLANEPASAEAYKKSKSSGSIGTTVQIIVQVGVSVAGGLSIVAILAGAGAGFVACLPFALESDKQFKEAIRLYNEKNGAQDKTVTTQGVQKSKSIEGNQDTIKPADNTVKVEAKKIESSTAKSVLKVGDTVKFYDFGSNKNYNGTIIEVKSKVVVIEYTSFDKKKVVEKDISDVTKVN